MAPSSAPDESAATSSRETLADNADATEAELTASLAQGQAIGRYVILYRIGGGGMGSVYAAYDPELDRRVAVKVLRRKRTGKGSTEEVDRARMLREAQALARLSHPNVVAVHDAGLHEGRVFVAMDFVEGLNLRQWVERTAPGWREVVAAYIDAAKGLAAAHEAGLVHRDFKPENAVRDTQGRVRVLDFGLARTTGNTGSHRAVRPKTREEIKRRLATNAHISIDTPLTIEGARVGTPAYMAPEQHLGESTDARSDQFSFCVSLYESLYRRLPFPDDSVHVVAFAAIEGEVRDPPKGSNVPQWLHKIVLRGLSPEAEHRWPSIEALIEQLQYDPTVRRNRVLAGFGALAFAGVATWAYVQPDEGTSPCSAGARRVAEVYDDARADAIATRFSETIRPYAARSADTANVTLASYAADWEAGYVAACEATHVRHEQSDALLDLRMACLDRRLEALDALASRFERADEDVVDHAVAATQTLPEISACADVDALRRGPPPPEGAQALTRGLAEASAALSTGKENDAVQTGIDLVEQARRVGDAGLLAEALSLLGSALEAQGKYVDARARLVEASIAAEEAKDERLLARVRVLLVMVTGDRLADPDQGHLWAELADPLVERLQLASLRVQLRSNLGHLASREGDPKRILAYRQEALALARDLQPPDPLAIATITADLATALADQHRLDEAAERAREALRLWTDALGPDHRRTAFGHGVLAYVLDHGGDYETARTEYERAVQILEAALGPDTLPVAAMRSNLAITSIRMGDHVRGEAEFRRVLAIKERELGPEHVDVASAVGNLAGIVRMRGNLSEGERLARRALEIRRATLPEDHPELASSLATLANVLEEQGQLDEVIPMREQAIAIVEHKYGEDHPKLIVDLANLAYSCLLVGELAKAQESAERAVAIAEGKDVRPELPAFARLVLARVWSERGRAADEIRRLTDVAVAELGDRSATAERKILAELVQRHGWDDLEPATHAPK